MQSKKRPSKFTFSASDMTRSAKAPQSVFTWDWTKARPPEVQVLSKQQLKARMALEQGNLRGYLPQLTYILKANPDWADKVDNEGNTFLHHALAQGEIKLAETLVREYKLDIHAVNNAGQTPYHFALVNKQYPLPASMYVETEALNTFVSRELHENRTAAFQCVPRFQGDLNDYLKLLNMVKDGKLEPVELVRKPITDNYGSTIIHYAIWRQDPDVGGQLVAELKDVRNIMDAHHQTLLHYNSTLNKPELVKQLIAKNADIHALAELGYEHQLDRKLAGKQLTPFDCAMYYSCFASADILLKHQAKFNIEYCNDPAWAFDESLKNGYVFLAKELLKAKPELMPSPEKILALKQQAHASYNTEFLDWLDSLKVKDKAFEFKSAGLPKAHMFAITDGNKGLIASLSQLIKDYDLAIIQESKSNEAQLKKLIMNKNALVHFKSLILKYQGDDSKNIIQEVKDIFARQHVEIDPEVIKIFEEIQKKWQFREPPIDIRAIEGPGKS